MECLGENKEKYKNFSAPIEKEVTKAVKEGEENIIIISYKIKYIHSARFMSNSLANFLNNLAEKIHKIKCKDCACFLEYESVNNNLIKYTVLSYNKDY